MHGIKKWREQDQKKHLITEDYNNSISYSICFKNLGSLFNLFLRIIILTGNNFHSSVTRVLHFVLFILLDIFVRLNQVIMELKKIRFSPHFFFFLTTDALFSNFSQLLHVWNNPTGDENYRQCPSWPPDSHVFSNFSTANGSACQAYPQQANWGPGWRPQRGVQGRRSACGGYCLLTGSIVADFSIWSDLARRVLNL